MVDTQEITNLYHNVHEISTAYPPPQGSVEVSDYRTVGTGMIYPSEMKHLPMVELKARCATADVTIPATACAPRVSLDRRPNIIRGLKDRIYITIFHIPRTEGKSCPNDLREDRKIATAVAYEPIANNFVGDYMFKYWIEAIIIGDMIRLRSSVEQIINTNNPPSNCFKRKVYHLFAPPYGSSFALTIFGHCRPPQVMCY